MELEFEDDFTKMDSNWESAYKKLFAMNEKHIEDIELADNVIRMFMRRVEQQAAEIERLRSLLHDRSIPAYPACEFDDDSLEY